MYLTEVFHDDIISQEGSLELYLGDLPSWEDKVSQAKLIVASKLKNLGKKIRLLTTPLYFLDSSGNKSIAQTTSFNSEKTSEDTIERSRFIIEVSVFSGIPIKLTIQGTNDDSSESYEDVVMIAINQIGEYTQRVVKPFKYYRLSITATTSITFKAYLVEDSFFLPVLFKAISLIYLELKNESGGGEFENKYKDYDGLFEDAFESLVFSYDGNEDGELQSSEINLPKRIDLKR